MKQLTKQDIGGEIISILTKGMYPDPRDAVREYIQNAVDAKASDVSVRVKQNSVIIEDNGTGMDYQTLRNAIRLGVSDKIPGKDVGFMGIGIYSAFHLCDSLTIYTRQSNKSPLMLKLDFKGMKTILQEERTQRLNKEISGDDITDLQTLLENHITLTNDGDLTVDEYPVEHGTQVELDYLDPVLADLLNNFDDLSNYLRDVVPLHFDETHFRWAKTIENIIVETCNRHDAHFDVINLKLEAQNQSAQLFRPYKDSDFHNSTPLEPVFKEIKKDRSLIGISWACLNSTRSRISNKELRGFLLKKQGFSIGKRENLAKYFGTSNTHFDRYIGEIIVISPNLLPNAARNSLEASSLQKWFMTEVVDEIATFYNKISDKFQNEHRAAEVLEDNGNKLKKIYAEYNENEENPDALIKTIAELLEIKRKVGTQTNKVRRGQKKEVTDLLHDIDEFETTVKNRVDFLITKNSKKPGKKNKTVKTKVSIGKNLAGYDATKAITKFDNLLEFLDAVEIEYSDELKELFVLIDEKFIQSLASNKEEYYKLLDDLMNEFENRQVS
jgi:hypothetical protein